MDGISPGTALAPASTGGALAPVSAEGSMLNFIATALERPEIDAQKLQALLQAQFMVEDRDAQRQFNAALYAAQKAMPRVTKRGAIDLGKGKPIPFATWEDMDTVLRPIMAQHGFSLSFSATSRADGTGAVVTARLLHSAGHAETFSMPLPPDVGPGRNALQAMGSTLSYAKRYLAEMAFNVVREGQDDDGATSDLARITAEQKDQIVQLMQDAKADTKGFLTFLGIETLDDLPQKDFARAANALQAKINKARGSAG